MRDRRRWGRLRSPDDEHEDNAAWRLVWALIGAVAFTVVLLVYHLI